eukprot:CAMPEP_0115857874 /NCGR_PEP_ID=MMETSP0287-20121206/15803_1 /TAXON_ID=412157 /ORGANISM="Chrysochromulina rotalis, Strain UIO044" /LENGTH=223 /DNA_ID=CAMNT_0003312113 /DNA_START=364 /DNA_END=1034 /DNA_ORIENTATION=-
MPQPKSSAQELSHRSAKKLTTTSPATKSLSPQRRGMQASPALDGIGILRRGLLPCLRAQIVAPKCDARVLHDLDIRAAAAPPGTAAILASTAALSWDLVDRAHLAACGHDQVQARKEQPDRKKISDIPNEDDRDDVQDVDKIVAENKIMLHILHEPSVPMTRWYICGVTMQWSQYAEQQRAAIAEAIAQANSPAARRLAADCDIAKILDDGAAAAGTGMAGTG